MKEEFFLNNLTRGGVAYNLDSSPFRYRMDYEDFYVTFIFSSELYMNKFITNSRKNRNKINTSLSNRFGFNVQFDLLSDIKLYTSIEKRGFLLYRDGERIECLSSITLGGEKATRNS